MVKNISNNAKALAYIHPPTTGGVMCNSLQTSGNIILDTQRTFISFLFFD